MWNLVKKEFDHISKELKTLDSKVVAIFLSSIVLFTISWYFSNPKFFRENVSFLQSEEIIFEELVSFIYWFILDFILLFIIPIYFIKLLFKEELKSYGLSFGEKKTGIIYTVISILIFIPIIYFVTKSSNFSQYFPLMQNAKYDIYVFLIYEIFLILFVFSWEFIFRGFILFGLEKKFGFYAIFIQLIPYVLLHSGKPLLETFASIFGGLFLGYLAIRTRSILYGFIIHILILVSLDIIAFIRV